jgi:hypothetical protein
MKCRSDDINDIMELINFTGKWKYDNITNFPKHMINPKPILQISTSNRKLVDFLCEMDYNKKSGISSKKIMNILPDDKKRYWFLGLCDGDGSWINFKDGTRGFSIASVYHQDWEYFENLLTSLGIKYSIYREINKNGSGSKICIRNKNGISILKKYLWPNGFELGLNRKYTKANT